MKLNDAQIRAVQAGNGPQLILAGAGSGKTRTIVHRIGHLISAQGVAPHRIMAVTFTNKAAAELKSRLAELIGDEGGGVISGTFHALSLRFLRRYAEALEYERDFQVLDVDDQKLLIKRILKARNIDTERLHPGYLLSWIDRCKNAGLNPDEAPDDRLNRISLRELYAVYQTELKHLGRMDFGDLLLNVVTLMRNHADIAAAIRSRFDHVLVDEYQDTNPVQHQWLLLICTEHRNLTVVGDDDQAIYGWRGADICHILEFEQVWQGAVVHRLEENYRSSGAILNLANAIIRDNPHRHEKVLKTTRENGSVPQWRVCSDEYNEARTILKTLQSRHELGIPWREMAVLYRSNRQSLPIEQVFHEKDTPYRVIGGVGFFVRMEIKDALAYWALLHNCADALHLLRVCNKPKRGIGAKGQEAISRMLSESGLRAAGWLDEIASGHGHGAASKLEPLAQLIGKHRPLAMGKPDLGLGNLLEESGYLSSLQALGQLEVESRTENIRTLQNFIEISMMEGLSPVDFMDRASLLQSGEEESSDDSVSLMSLHRAKGLEFDTVVIAGVEEGLIPHQRSLDEDRESGLAEERRLLYVGITRARNYLMLTMARMRRVFGDLFFPSPSQFIAGLSDEVMEFETPAPVVELKRQEHDTGIRVGVDVGHPTFGDGVVLAMEGVGDARRITVQFRKAGLKRLMLKYAALELL